MSEIQLNLEAALCSDSNAKKILAALFPELEKHIGFYREQHLMLRRTLLAILNRTSYSFSAGAHLLSWETRFPGIEKYLAFSATSLDIALKVGKTIGIDSKEAEAQFNKHKVTHYYSTRFALLCLLTLKQKPGEDNQVQKILAKAFCAGESFLDANFSNTAIGECVYESKENPGTGSRVEKIVQTILSLKEAERLDNERNGVEVYCDASVNGGKTWIAAYVPQLGIGYQRVFEYSFQVDTAEAMAILLGHEVFDSLIIMTDSMNAVAMLEEAKSKSVVSPNDRTSIFSKFVKSKVPVRWIPRERNAIADAVSKFQSSKTEGFVLVKDTGTDIEICEMTAADMQLLQEKRGVRKTFLAKLQASLTHLDDESVTSSTSTADSSSRLLASLELLEQEKKLADKQTKFLEEMIVMLRQHIADNSSNSDNSNKQP